MITQVGGPSESGAAKDPRRKSQIVQFDSSSKFSYSKLFTKGSDTYAPSVDKYRRQKQSAFWTSVSAIMGSVIFVGGVLILSALQNSKKLAAKI